LRPTANRLINESRSGSKITKSESIRIGDKIYKREGDEAWVETIVKAKSQPKAPDTTAPASANNQAKNQVEYKYLGSEKFNNQTTNVYAWIEKTKPADPPINNQTLFISTHKYWFSEDGILLKEEWVTEGRRGEDTLYSRLTTVWELDPSIKVEAPAINLS
jgi:hypothetical protein